jgi:hypothetical protein
MIHHVDIFAHQTHSVIFLANVVVMFPVFRKVKYVQVRDEIIAINNAAVSSTAAFYTMLILNMSV